MSTAVGGLCVVRPVSTWAGRRSGRGAGVDAVRRQGGRERRTGGLWTSEELYGEIDLMSVSGATRRICLCSSTFTTDRRARTCP